MGSNLACDKSYSRALLFPPSCDSPFIERVNECCFTSRLSLQAIEFISAGDSADDGGLEHTQPEHKPFKPEQRGRHSKVRVHNGVHIPLLFSDPRMKTPTKGLQ